jgi:hypothetical protein
MLLVLVVAACGTGAPAATGAASSGGPAPLVKPTTASVESPTAVGSPSAAVTVTDGCALLTDAQIEEVTGMPVESKKPAGGISPIGCQWDLDEGDPNLIARMLLNVVPSGGRALFDPYAADLFDPKPVPGLGDKAVAEGGFILAVQGDALIALGYPGFAFEDGVAEALVAMVFARL